MKSLLLAVCFLACSKAREPSVERRDEVKVGVIPATSRQLITGVTDDWTATTATLQLWHRDSVTWVAVGRPWVATVGATGTAWGIGQHGNGPPAGRSGPRKHEGDRKAPAGAFALRGAFGYAATPPATLKLAYTPEDENLKCVDDPASLHYASIVSKASTEVDWKSAEDMLRKDDLYVDVVDVAHNPSRVPGEGSCIFLHVWKDALSPTVGCTAMDRAKLEELMVELDPAMKPTYVLLPRDEYRALASTWGLPPL